ncbi:MAG: hypothetical protein VX768_04165 [Planctomycetota bacterium]|nr:hypothetical protein [Planctomycetota bacterium]
MCFSPKRFFPHGIVSRYFLSFFLLFASRFFQGFSFSLAVGLLAGFVSIVGGQEPVESSPLVKSFANHQRLRESTEYGVDWISVGPVVNSARVESVQVDPRNPQTLYVAFGSGGLWKSVNGGMTWQSKFEGHASYGIGDIALAPSDSKILYLGTGESLKKARNFTIPGTGIYRSDDAGETWRNIGLPDSWHIGEIAVHPRDPNVVLVAVLGHFWSENRNRGLYRTGDGGKTWQQVIAVDSQTGANDVVFSPSDPEIVYASLWQNHPGVAGSGSGIYRSADGGQNWVRCEAGLPSGDQVGRIGLAVSGQDPQKVYALVDNREFAESSAAEVYRSLDGGKSWKRTHQQDLPVLSRIGWYFADLYVNPQDDEEVYALGVRLAHSVDGGKTFDYLSGNVRHLNPTAASGLHLDQCEMWIHPLNPDHLVLGNDGGLYQSHDRGRNWLHHNNLPTGEFYDIEIEQSVPYRIFAGAQDDATVFGPPTELDANRQVDPWRYLWIDPWNGGDGCVTLVDPEDPQTVYYSAQEGAIRRKDMKTDQSRGIRPGLPKDFAKQNGEARLAFNFVAPMILSPHDSKRIYLGANFLFQSDHRGDEWKVISPDLSRSGDPERQSKASSAIAESTLAEGLVYVGTDRGLFWISEDAGKSWAERSKDLPPAYIRSIVPSRHVASRVLVTLSGLNYDDFRTHVYVSEDRGRTWKSIASNLTQEPANVIAEDPIDPDRLYLGTFRGVYLSTNRGASWSLMGRNLPVCSVADLAIHETSRELVVGTHGRGIYRTSLLPLDRLQKEAQRKGPRLLHIGQASLPRLGNTRPTLNFREFGKTTISFWLPEKKDVKLVVSQSFASGKKESGAAAPLVVLEPDTNSGLNQFRWDLVVRKNRSQSPYFFKYRSHLTPGTYQVGLHVDGREVSRLPMIVGEAPR